MEKFHDGHHVWLRSRVHGTYLRAGEDGSGVSLHEGRASVHAAWAVHILHLDGGDILMLHSAANGRYLAAPRTGWSWNSVDLRDLNQLPSFTVGWFAVTAGSGDYVMLRHSSSGLFLRADGGNLLCNSVGVVVDMFDFRRREIRQWVVEAIPPRDSMPILPNPSPTAFSWCRIWYVRASPQGNFRREDWRSLLFHGRSVFHLRNRLASQLRIRESSDAILCVRAGSTGRVTPLVTDLPRNTLVIDIVVITAGTNGEISFYSDRLHIYMFMVLLKS
ncbi:hypothetical protein OsJ_20219 [Oryza sativa Japonica Group]|uniref:Uncharacterized protein n=3 Tax=Oryza TaxID=4527 RepID=Q5WA96_ORYSJ|nr:hypothetical protein OsJ_20219 [Oryza sativa Japonica Group]BAD67639.1 hypothetical protein [Oryza sativa Japonica Group]